MNIAIAPAHRKPDSASTGWTDLFLEASDLIEKHVKCNCAFLNGHEPHCATVRAHEWRRKYHSLAATPSSGGQEKWTKEYVAKLLEGNYSHPCYQHDIQAIADAHNATLQPQRKEAK